MTVPPAGWYPDPSGTDGAEVFRWWDGSGWTDATSPTPGAPAPENPQPVGQRAPESSAADPADDPAGAPAEDPARAPAPRQHRAVALLVGLSLVISGGVVGLIGWRTFESERSAGRDTVAQRSPGFTSTARSSTGGTHRTTGQPGQQNQQGQVGRLDERTRTATLGDATMELPAQPYELVGQPVAVPGVFDAMFVANAPVHADFNGSDTWAATVGIGHIPADAWTGDDLHGFAKKALRGISQQFFGYNPTSVKQLQYQPVIVSGRACAEITANVHYTVKGLASKYDRLRIVGCPDGTDGSVVAAVSSVPDDADHRLSELATRSLATLTLR